LERLVRADQQGTEELESLALEGLNSGAPIEVDLLIGKRSISGSTNALRLRCYPASIQTTYK